MSASAARTVVDRTRERLGKVGVWLAPPTLRVASAAVERWAASRIEGLGYGSLWSGETIGGKEAFAHHGVLLAATGKLVVGTGIANVWARHGATMHAGAATLAEAYPGRFVLGVGVSHPRLAEQSGQDYGRPLRRMLDYLDEMDAAIDGSPRPPEPFPRLLAALRPRMMGLARERADGAQPFLVPVEHTARARETLGPGKLLVPHQAVILDSDPVRARATARSSFEVSRDPSSVYAQNFRSLGYGDEDLAGGLSDRLVDAVFAWGDETAIATRVREHLDAGADHVLVHPLTRERLLAQPDAGDVSVAVGQLERLAPALLSGF